MGRMYEKAVRTTEERAVAAWELIHPAVADGEKVAKLFFRRPNAGDLCAIESAYADGDFESDLVLIARTAGLTREEATLLSAEDVIGIRKELPRFFGAAFAVAVEEIKQMAMIKAGAASAISQEASSRLTGETP